MQVAPVASVKIARDYITRQSLGHGFVNFKAADFDAGTASSLQACGCNMPLTEPATMQLAFSLQTSAKSTL